MAVLFLDSSAVVKRYVTEVGSRWLTGCTDPAAGNVCWIASVTAVEVLAAFYIRVRTGTLSLVQAQNAELVFRNELNSLYQREAIGPPILQEAMRLVATHPLRAYDAIQLAVAVHVHALHLTSGSAITLVSADRALLLAAVAEGLTVEDPDLHP